MLSDNNYINPWHVSLAVREDDSTVTIYYALRGESPKSGKLRSKKEINDLVKSLGGNEQFVPLNNEREFLNLQWVMNGEFETGTNLVTVSIAGVGDRTYEGADAQTIRLRFMKAR